MKLLSILFYFLCFPAFMYSQKEDKVTKEEKINDTELSSFLKELQVCLSQGQVRKIAYTMVHYPLKDEGPLYKMLYGDIVYL